MLLFSHQVVFNVRGICESEEQIDRDYTLSLDSLEPKDFTLLGIQGLSNIKYNNTTKRWEIISLYQFEGKIGSILGFSNSTKFFPMGLKQWFLKGNCNAKGDEYTPSMLKLVKVCFYGKVSNKNLHMQIVVIITVRFFKYSLIFFM